MLTDEHISWLEARAIDIEMCSKMGLRSNQKRIAIPYGHSGKTVYEKQIDPADKANTRCLPSGIPQAFLWNTDCLQEKPGPRDVLIITEGEWDAISCLQAGLQYVVSLPSGAANTLDGCLSKAKRALCREVDGKVVLRDEIARFKRVVLAVDRDHDGNLMREALEQLIGKNYSFIPAYPDGCKDANDILKLGGVGLLHEVIINAAPAGDASYLSFTAGLRMKSPPQIYTGLDFLNENLILSRPEFLVIGGQANSGKSTIAQLLLFNILHRNPTLKASIFHGEGHVQIPARRGANWYRHHINDDVGNPRVQAERDRWLDERLSFINPPDGTLPTFEWLLHAMEMHALVHNRNILMIDPWNEIIHTRDMRGSMTEHVSECIIRMKRLASELGLILIVVHHVRKPERDNGPPTKYDLADSAHWSNKSDHILLVWRPIGENFKTRLEIARSKDFELLGRPGHLWVQFNAKNFSLHPCNPPEGYD